MFDRLKKLLQGNAPKEQSLDTPKTEWVAADQNPWNVPVLDVRPVTHQMLSTSTDPQFATNAVSYGQDDGTGFVAQIPPVSRVISSDLRYRFDRVLAPGALFLPTVMEHKWAIYYHEGRILFIRSWLRQVVVTAEIKCEEQHIARVVSIRGTFYGESEKPEFTNRVMDYLIRTHALGLAFPAPLPPDFEKLREEAAVWCMNMFGNLVACATSNQIGAEIPDKPLRTHSLLHIAVARGDTKKVEDFLKDGLPIDLLAADGLTPLHWAFARGDTRMASFLIERGSAVDVRSAQGATPLMTEVQRGELLKIKFLIDAGADVNAVDSRGFNSLHRVAESGNLDVVKLLLDSGAKTDGVAQGITALSLAESRGHKEIVQLLKRFQTTG